MTDIEEIEARMLRLFQACLGSRQQQMEDLDRMIEDLGRGPISNKPNPWWRNRGSGAQ